MRLIAALFVLLLACFNTIGTAQASDGVTVPAGTTQDITGLYGVCKKVTNGNGSNSLYVPTTSVAEWQSLAPRRFKWVA